MKARLVIKNKWFDQNYGTMAEYTTKPFDLLNAIMARYPRFEFPNGECCDVDDLMDSEEIKLIIDDVKDALLESKDG